MNTIITLIAALAVIGLLENDYFPDTYLFPVLDSGASSSQEKMKAKDM